MFQQCQAAVNTTPTIHHPRRTIRRGELQPIVSVELRLFRLPARELLSRLAVSRTEHLCFTSLRAARAATCHDNARTTAHIAVAGALQRELESSAKQPCEPCVPQRSTTVVRRAPLSVYRCSTRTERLTQPRRRSACAAPSPPPSLQQPHPRSQWPPPPPQRPPCRAFCRALSRRASSSRAAASRCGAPPSTTSAASSCSSTTWALGRARPGRTFRARTTRTAASPRSATCSRARSTTTARRATQSRSGRGTCNS